MELVSQIASLYKADFKSKFNCSYGIVEGPGVYLTLESLEKAREVAGILNAAYAIGVSDERTRMINLHILLSNPVNKTGPEEGKE